MQRIKYESIFRRKTKVLKTWNKKKKKLFIQIVFSKVYLYRKTLERIHESNLKGEILKNYLLVLKDE